jgi:hypothetical protein
MKLLITTIIAFFAFAAPSYAASACNYTAIIQTDLTTNYNEVLVNSVMLPNTNILEVYASSNHLTWSIIVVVPSEGMACMVNYGGGRASLDAALDQYLGSPM